jgi:hypothetical protein
MRAASCILLLGDSWSQSRPSVPPHHRADSPDHLGTCAGCAGCKAAASVHHHA